MDQLRFEEALNHVLNQAREPSGIGTLAEKTVHAVLKYYYCPDVTCHEQRVCGYVADICIENKIIEIQTGNFNLLRKKLDAYLPEHDVTIVSPVTRTKWLCWIDPGTGSVTPKRKSPKTGRPHEIFFELYKIKQYLSHPNLHICISMLDLEEYRLLDGYSKDKKKGSHRNDAFPISYAEEVVLESTRDYPIFLPYELPEEFTVDDYKATTRLPRRLAGTILHILCYHGVIERTGTKSKSYLYKVTYENLTLPL